MQVMACIFAIYEHWVKELGKQTWSCRPNICLLGDCRIMEPFKCKQTDKNQQHIVYSWANHISLGTCYIWGCICSFAISILWQCIMVYFFENTGKSQLLSKMFLTVTEEIKNFKKLLTHFVKSISNYFPWSQLFKN